MRNATLAALFLTSMMMPGRADDIMTQANPIPQPLPEIANPEQQVWRWTNQSGVTEPGDFLAALDRPSATTDQITTTIGPAQDSTTMATADIGADDTRASITGSLSVPLPLGTPRQKPQISPTPLSPVTAGPIDALGYIGDDGIFHAK